MNRPKPVLGNNRIVDALQGRALFAVPSFWGAFGAPTWGQASREHEAQRVGILLRRNHLR